MKNIASKELFLYRKRNWEYYNKFIIQHQSILSYLKLQKFLNRYLNFTKTHTQQNKHNHFQSDAIYPFYLSLVF